MGNLKPAVIGLGGAAVTGVVSSIFGACPDLRPQLAAVLLAGIGGAVTTYMLRPQSGAGWKATLTGIGTLIVAGVAAKVTAICPDLIAQLPALAMAGVTTGLGLYLRSHRESA